MKLIFFLIFFSFYFKTNSSLDIVVYDCKYFSNKFSILDDSLLIKNLNNFSEINWFCISTLLWTKIGSINFYSIKTLEIDYQLDFNQVNLNLQKFNIQLNFINVKLSSFEKPIFIKLSNYSDIIQVNFFHFKLITPNRCSSIDSKNIGIFQSVYSVAFAFTVKYFINTCPSIFKNSHLNKLAFHGLSNSFLKVNQIDFNQSIETSYLNNSIYNLNLNFFKGTVKKKFMIFKNVSILNLNGQIDSIENDALESLNRLQVINLDMSINLMFNGFKWTNFINKNLSINLSNQTLVLQNKNKIVYVFLNFDLIFNTEQYLYHDKDFCFFKDIPDSRLVFIFPKKNKFSEKIKNCTCLLLWLYKHKQFLWQSCSINNGLFISNCESELNKNNNDNVSLLEKCQFLEMIKNCDLKEKKNTLNVNFYSNFIYYFKIFDLNLFIITIFFILVSFTTSIFNLFILTKIQFSNQTKKYFSTEKLMLFNTIINFLFTWLLIFHQLKKCISPYSFICSSINNSVLAQIVDIYFFRFLGNILKFLSYLLQLIVSTKRLTSLSPQFNQKIRKLFKNKFLKAFILLFCLFYPINELVPLILMTKINRLKPGLDETTRYVEYPDVGLFFLSYSLSVQPVANYLTNQKFNSPFLFYILNFVINHLLCIFLFVFIEFKLFINFRSAIIKKEKFRSQNASYNNSSLNRSLNTIIINMVTISILRFFETLIFGLIVYLKSTGNTSKYNICLRYSKFCTIISELNDILFLITISFNSIYYYLIEKKFRDSLKKSFRRFI